MRKLGQMGEFLKINSRREVFISKTQDPEAIKKNMVNLIIQILWQKITVNILTEDKQGENTYSIFQTKG